MTNLEVTLLLVQVFTAPLLLFHGRYSKAGIGETPLVFSSAIGSFLLSIGALIFLIASIGFLFINWQLALIGLFATLAGWRYIVVPVLDKTF